MLDTYDDAGRPPDDPQDVARPYVCILFECCNIYARIYRRPEEAVYRGRCPRCLAQIRMAVGPDGTPARFFRAR